ncbi:uncharacterized protein BT62DRAFT_738837 [Guyanagaster necrorhizus]|uniref:Uncharacterized protein n=1 Tax=Guyanagaster necrorhizus TaxID=856835 RepID=A0A9P7VG49_9AGAR|nr:uncharacterized protein BT62DRAFT_738837 [Guyanagaster necrorhizus MCA 3950]KAG7439379.1 hypothetical protein BT62DRAFT_738837 [Guyanagaster necrorhizus MCA 3950]
MSSDQLRFTTERALPPEVLKHVISCRSAILSSSREARKHKVDAERERLPEAEVRTAWDGLINACTRIPGNDDVKPRLERMLQLPRNDVHDMPTRSDFAKRLRQWESEVAEYGDHSSEKSHEDAARLYCIAEAAAQAALTLRSHSHELSLSGSEPKQAKCDGITAATLGNFPPEHITLTASDRSRLKKLALLPSRRSKPVSHTRAPLTSASPSADFKKAFDNNDLVATSRLQRPVSPSDDLSVALQVLSLDSREADTTSYTVLRDETLHASTSDSDSGDDDNGNDEDSDEDDNRDTEDDGSGSEDSDEGGDTDIEKGRDDEDIVNSDGNTPQPDTDDDEDAPDDKATNTNILLLPLLVQEYKKFLDNMQQNGVNQGRMDLIACIKFLSALGIHNFPVFSIITEGTLGTVCCAYMKDDKEGRIYEHNVRTFDVSNPVDAFNLATFLTFIVTIHKRKLMDQFTVGKQQELWQNFRDKNKTLNWAMSHQFPSV